MSQNLADDLKLNEPLLTTVGRGLRTGTDAAGVVGSNIASAADSAPKLIGIPAAGIANFMARSKQQLQAGFNDTPVPAPVSSYQAKSFSDLFGGSTPATAAPLNPSRPATSTAPTTTVGASPASSYVPGAGLPSAAEVASDRARANASQNASDAALGVSGTGGAHIGVTRQANGVLSFSGSGGDGSGGVVYTGLPNFKSQQGGAGQGAVDFGGQAFHPAQQAIASGQGFGAPQTPLATAQGLAEKIASGAGGPVGVAQNHLALQALSGVLSTTIQGQSSQATARIGAGAQRYAADRGFDENAARVGAELAGQNVQKQIHAQGNVTALEGQKIRAAAINRAGSRRLASSQADHQEAVNQMAALAYSGKNPDGTPATPAQSAVYLQRARDSASLATGNGLNQVSGIQQLQNQGMLDPNSLGN